MSTKIRHKRSAVAGKKPTISQLESGELAINTADGKVFLLRDDNTIQDLTQRIFENNSQILVSDPGDSAGEVTITIDGSQKITVNASYISLQENTQIEDASTLTFNELIASGNNGVSIKAPNTLDAGYTLVLPPNDGIDGNLLRVNGVGELFFASADTFGGNVIYVSAEKGDDTNDGLNLPVRTVKKACQIASGLVYNSNGTVNGRRINIKVAVGDYTEQNPIIVPDNVVIKGDGLRGCLIRPANANLDMLRVRNACYFGEFTFRDKVDVNFVPQFTWDYAVSFDDPDDATTSRVGYTNLPTTRPSITSSPYIQNCSIISFLGGNGAKIDGSKVSTPNAPPRQIEAENPVAGPSPEQGKSMVANAFTHISFGGTGWRLTNDAYAQIVSCFQIFLLNGIYAQSGGYVSITNSATNFGLYALRSSGFSPKTFEFDRSIVVATGVSSGAQTLTVVGIGRTEPVNEFVIRFRNPEYKIAYDLIESNAGYIAQDTIDWIDAQIAGATPGSIWDGYIYNAATFYAELLIILDAVARDTWSTGNTLTRQAALSYYTGRLADSSNSTISGQEDQTIAALEQASVYTATVLASLDSTVRAFVDEKFDLIKDAISDPNSIPDAVDVTSEGDITNDYKSVATVEIAFDASTDVNVTTNIFSATAHGLTNGQSVIYDPVGNTPVGGLDAEQTYYVKVINENEFSLTFDESGDFNVDITSTSTGSHEFLANTREFFVNDITSSHQTYQKLILESGAESYEFVPGRAIAATTGAGNNSAYVYSWKPVERELIVSVELVAVGSSTLRNTFTVSSIITTDHADIPNTNIGINEVSNYAGLGTATFTIQSTVVGTSLTNLANLPEKQCWFHRPSIVNSSSHTWEYSGSGVDYNALPQNGGRTREEYEQYEELPGRVYTSGTNELGDFKVGTFITAYNRTGNITFRNKVQVDELDALRLTLSDIAIEEISTNVNLGDDELGGSSNSRLSTQLAIRSFLSNRLGGFIDKAVSTAAVPGAIVQLNTNGQLNPELIPATRQFTSTTTQGYLSRLLQVDEIPAVDLKAGDIATEEYEQVELTLPSGITVNDGDEISQPGIAGAVGYAKGNYGASLNLLVASVEGEWDSTDDSTGDPWDTGVSAPNLYVNNVDSGIKPSSKGTSSAIIDNFFLKSSNSSQYLILSNDDDYNFTSAAITFVSRSSNVATITTLTNHNLRVGNSVRVDASDHLYDENGIVLSIPTNTTFTIANTGANESIKAVTGYAYTLVTSADGNAQGAVTETRYGVCTNVDNTNFTPGFDYAPATGTYVWEMIPLTSVTGVGTGALADLTVTDACIVDVDIRRGGTGYAVGDLLSVNPNFDGVGLGHDFEIEITAIEKRAYVNIIGGELFVASTSSVDFVEDNDAPLTKQIIDLEDSISQNFLAGDVGAGGNVDYVNYRITITNHGYSNGDPVSYNTLGNVAIGGMINGEVYYAKSITANTIELYEDFSLVNKIEFLSTPANNNHNLTRYVVNIADNSITVVNHGFATGDAIKISIENDGSSVSALPDIASTEIVDGSRFFIGSVTTNSFTLHELRSDALASINGLVVGAKNITSTGVGHAIVILQNVQVNGVVNTSSRLKANWNSLAVTNIDASNIISGIVSPTRLAGSGTANSDTVLYGDSSYRVVVQNLIEANTTDNPITLTGSNISGEYYGDVSIGIANVDYDPGELYSTLGTARFLQSQFDVDTGASGQVFIKDGVVDAGTLDSLDSSYFLDPSNLTSNVPVNKGGTNLSAYSQGDIIYAQSTSTLNTLNIGRANNFLKSNGTTPEWSTALDLAEGLDVGSARLSSTSTGIGLVYNDNVTTLELGSAAETVKIGKSTATRNITSFIDNYDATSSTTVTVNLESFTAATDGITGNGDKEVPMASTSGILAGMLVTGSASIPANTTVSGVTTDYVYLSAETTGTISSSTTLTFTYTPFTLGIRAGDTINIASSTVSNLDGQWPVLGATFNATSFTIKTNANVTVSSSSPIAGTLTKDNTMLIRNRNVIFGSAEASSSTANATLKGESGIGTNIAGGAFTIQAGLGTGNATGGNFVVKTGEVGSSSAIEQTSTTRLTIDTSGLATFTGDVKVDDALTVDGNVTFNSTTGSTGYTSGALVVDGGVGIAENLYVNGTVNVTEANLGRIDFSPTAYSSRPSYQEGRLYYDSDFESLVLFSNNSNFDITLGEREFIRCRNSSGATINKGQPVYVTGVYIAGDAVFGRYPTVALADASDLNKIEVIGLAGHNIANGAEGYVIVSGYIDGIDTSNLTSGQKIHLGFDAPGTLVQTAPDYPNFPVDIGICLTSNASTGSIYIELRSHTVEKFRVTEGAYFDADVTVAGDLIVLGSQSSVKLNNLEVDSSFIYLNSGDTIGNDGTTFTGTGLDDATLVGHYQGTTTQTFYVRIDSVGGGTGGVDTFEWSLDNFSTTEATDIDVDTDPVALADGISVVWVSTTGHTLNDIWSGSASPVNVDVGVTGNRNTGTSGVGYTHLGFFFDVTDQKFKFFDEYDPAITGNINVADASFSLGTVVADAFEGNLTATSINVNGTATIGTLDVSGLGDIGGDFSVNTNKFTVTASSGNTSVAGTLGVTGESTLASATISDLTNNRIVIAGTGGIVEDDANFRFDGTNFDIGASGSEKFRVVVASGNTSVAGTLTVTGQTDLNGDINLGNATSDTITFVGRMDSNLEPSTNDARDLGTSSLAWKDLYLSESVNFKGATTENEIVFPTNLVDGLSITDGSNDFIVFTSTTGSNAIALKPDVNIDATTASSSTTTGALVVDGGVGIAGNVHSGGTFTGNGSGLTTLNASNISSGTISDSYLPTSQAGKTFTSDITVNSHKVGRGGGNSATNLAIAGGQAISTGTDNLVVGVGAMGAVVTGTDNVALGNTALALVTSSTHNTAIGNDALAQAAANAGYNVAVGAQSMQNTTGTVSDTATNNVAVGYQALAITTGKQNVAIGSNAGDSIALGSNNIVIGYNADASTSTTSNEITLGNGSITNFRIPGVTLTASTTTLTFGGTSGFSGVGTNLTALNATELTSGTVAGARLGGNQTMAGVKTFSDTTASSSTITGAVIIGGGLGVAGNIHLGGTITGNGSGLTTLNASNLSSGTVDGARLGGTQTMAGAKTFSDTTASSSHTTGAVIIGGGLGVAGNVYSNGIFNGNGSGLTTLNASQLTSGTVPSDRLTGTYAISVSGNAATATKWATARTITLGGDLSGSVSIDGSAAVTLTATIAADSVALGTDTTGNYVATVAAGTPGAETTSSGLTISATAGEGTAATIAHADTSTLTGAQGSAGIAAITLDGFGHVTAVTTATYLTSQSSDFGTVTVTDTDSGYTWAETGSAVADTTGDTLTLVSGSGINIDVAATSDAIRITNTDLGSSQNIFKNITLEQSDGTAIDTVVADSNNDTLYIRAGAVDSTNGIDLVADTVADRITISHSNTSGQNSLSNTGRTYIQSVTLDTYGHVTGLTTATETVVDTNTTYTAGTGLTLSGTTFNANVNATTQTVASNAVSATASRTYAVQVDGSDNLVVNVPWSDTDTNTDTLQSIATDSTNATRYITFVANTTGAQTGLVNTNFSINPSTQTLILSGANNATAGSSQLYLNGASGNRIDWNVNGVDLPAFTTRSAGTKLLLYPAIGAAAVDYAIGIGSSTLWHSVPTASATTYFRWYGGTTQAAVLTGDGTFTATGDVCAFSDVRVKDNIEVIADPLTKILSIRGVTFTRTDKEDTERRHMGVIAQEVEKYFPEVVHEGEDGIKSVNYGAFAGAFIEAFKEQQRQIDELRSMLQKVLDK